MKTIVLSVCFLPGLFFTQNNSIGIDFSVSENSLYLKSIIDRNQFFGLESIFKSPGGIIYRFWNTRTCIEVSNINGTVKGKVVLAVKNQDNESYFRKSYELSHDQTENVFNIINQYDIDHFPTDSKIKGWIQGFDGNVIDIESNIDQHYIYKKYWTPGFQNIPESKIIMNITDDIEKATAVAALIKKFDSEIKAICYRFYGTAYSICKIMTKKEMRKLKKKKNRL
ncbi:hypothetical protein [Chryseobacterium arthrosphaerae]|uniref:hypothetical protein n=1 Tax=Chryseobacterium arthrosphaerae TaxID=651561 RepID=UPI00241D49A7|nr:hypothetical protein [Chryseobacterium arthrosphaerae]